MKKFLVIALVLSLLAVSALAEDKVTVTGAQMDWNQSTIDAFVKDGFDGNMATVTLTDGKQFKIMVPDGFAQRDLTEDEKATGVAVAIANAQTGAEYRILDCKFETAENLTDVAKTLEGIVSSSQYALVNGVAALITSIEAEDSMNATFELGDHRYVQIDFTPVNGNNKLIPYLIASVQF